MPRTREKPSIHAPPAAAVVKRLQQPTQEGVQPRQERLRQPRQERGARRVEAILDAAAAILAEGGTEGLTVQALADRARTSKGSLYHFFPDLTAVLCALAARHRAAIAHLTEGLITDRRIDWPRLTPEETVDRFLAPLAYLAAHPDLAALVRTPMVLDQTMRRMTPVCDLASHILKQRCPDLAPRRRRAAAATMVAMVDGSVSYGLRSDEVQAKEMLAELRRALAAYDRALRL